MHTVNLPRTCLGFVNIVFFVLSAVFFVICVWCSYNADFFTSINYKVTKSSLVSRLANFVTLKLWVTRLTTIFIPILTIIMLTTCCGLLGAGCRTQCALKSYVFLLSLITFFFAYIFFVSIVYNIYMNNTKTRQYMTLMIFKDYGKKHDFISEMFDYLMTNFECCGSESVKDFVVSNWRNQSVDKTVLYPTICCHLNAKSVPINPNCTITYDIKEYNRIGCFYAIQHAIFSHKKKLVFYLVLAGMLYSVTVLFTLSIAQGKPLLGSWAQKRPILLKNDLKEPPEEAKFDKVVPAKKIENAVDSNTSLQNMMFVEEPPKKVVKIVSAFNPSQTYVIRPHDFAHGDSCSQRPECLPNNQIPHCTHGCISHRPPHIAVNLQRSQAAPNITSQRSEPSPNFLNQRPPMPPALYPSILKRPPPRPH